MCRPVGTVRIGEDLVDASSAGEFIEVGTPVRVAGIDNLLVSGMMITSDHRAHMSTRNTVCCMGQGQASGTAAALCALKGVGTRELAYADLRKTLENDGVHLER